MLDKINILQQPQETEQTIEPITSATTSTTGTAESSDLLLYRTYLINEERDQWDAIEDRSQQKQNNQIRFETLRQEIDKREHSHVERAFLHQFVFVFRCDKT